MKRAWVVVAVVLAAGSARATCPGDCNGDGVVTVPEVVTVVNIALGSLPLSACPAAFLEAAALGFEAWLAGSRRHA